MNGFGCIAIAACMAVLPLLSQAAEEEWDNLDIIEINTEQPHATMTPYPDEDTALADERDESPWIELLNGDWKFNWSETPASRPCDFFKQGFDDADWDTIPVPSNWQVHGHGTAIYTNIKYPYPKRPPQAPREYNPVGSYRTRFEVPSDWDGRKLFVHFGGVTRPSNSGSTVRRSATARAAAPPPNSISPNMSVAVKICWRWRSIAGARAPI